MKSEMLFCVHSKYMQENKESYYDYSSRGTVDQQRTGT